MATHSMKNKSDSCFLNGNDGSAVVSVLTKFAPLVKSRAFFFMRYGCELEDLIQEGNIGLLVASAKYNCELSAFTTFARKCIDSAIIDYLRKVRKISNIPNELLVDISAVEVADSSQSPEYSLSVKDEYDGLVKKAKMVLSEFEHSVFSDIIRGLSFSEIAESNGCEVKSIHNAVGRIRAKLK